MPTINENLRDESIAHSVWLSRYPGCENDYC